MSGHVLPDDPSRWPRDPFAVLGIARATPPREVRKAYHALIRQYKPEHHPEAFRRIREAFEQAQRIHVFVEEDEPPVDDPGPREPGGAEAAQPQPPPSSPPPGPAETGPATALVPPSPGAWDLARRGDLAAGYSALVQDEDRARAAEEHYLQLYWLLAIAPELEPDRRPADWLVRGLLARGVGAWRLLEMLGRATAADPDWALGPSIARLLMRSKAADVLRAAAHGRWLAARNLGRWNVIINDVKDLRERADELEPALWIRLLLLAAENLAWDLGTRRDAAGFYRRLAEPLAEEHAVDIAEELYRLEYVERIVNGLIQVRRKWMAGESWGEGPGRRDTRVVQARRKWSTVESLHRLLCAGWDDRGPRLRGRLLPYLREMAPEPLEVLGRLDTLQAQAPAALGLLWELTNGLTAPSRFRGQRPHEIRAEVESFLAASRWWEYRDFRPELLGYCVRERIDPADIARAVEGRPGYVVPSELHLADTIRTDLPLRLVYLAGELTGGY